MNTVSGTGRIAVLNQYFIDVLEAQSGGQRLTVWVMGGDARLRLDLAEQLPDGVTLGDFGTRLDDAADRLTRYLLDLDAQVLANEQDRLAWSASLIGDRSPYAGDLQLNAARYLVMDELVRGGGHHLFFVEDDIIAQVFEQMAQTNGLPVTWRGSKLKPPKGVEILRARASALKAYWRQSRVLKKLRATHPAPWAELATCDVVLVDWADANSFNTNGETSRSGNLARMADVLRKAGHKVGFVANPLSWTQPFEAIAENVVQAHDPVVMIDECRTTGSIVRGALATWQMGRRLKSATFKALGLDLSALFELERVKDIIRPQSTQAYSLVDVGMTLAFNGVRPKAIVYPYENQGWERALCEGVRRHLPDTRLVAYQHAPFAARYIGFFPPSSDINAGRLADQLVVMGERFAALFKDYGWPQDRLYMGGSLRFEPALDNPPERAKGDGKTVLAATSIEFGEALDLVVKVGAAVQRIANARLVVNFHPVVDQDFRDGVRAGLVQVVGEDVLDRVEFSDARAAELISQAEVMVYNNSGAVFDACFCGVPTVHVAVDGRLSYDKLPGQVSRRATDGADLHFLLNEILAGASTGVPDLSVGGMIAPVDETVIVRAVRGS